MNQARAARWRFAPVTATCDVMHAIEEVVLEAFEVTSVLARLSHPGGEQFTTPLTDRGDGRYGAIVSLPAARRWGRAAVSISPHSPALLAVWPTGPRRPSDRAHT